MKYQSEKRRSTERHVRTNLTIAASGKFKDAVLEMATSKNLSISDFVRRSLVDCYPRLKQFDKFSEYAMKRNPRLRKLQQQKDKAEKRAREPSLDDRTIRF